MDLYPVGQPIRLSTTVTDIAGAFADAGALSLLLYKDGLPVQTYPSPAHDSTGHYHQDIPATDIDAAGHYVYVWTATGANAGAQSDVFDVFDPAAYPRLVSKADARTFLGLSGTAGDALLERFVGWASARILREVQASLTTVTERRPADGYLLTVATVPVTAIVSLAAVGASTLPVDASALVIRSALGGVISSYPSWLCGVYDLTFTAGYTATPAGVDGACLALIRHWWNQSQAHGSATYGDAGFVPDFKGLPNVVMNMLASAPAPPPLMA
jgi:hypothetical protein